MTSPVGYRAWVLAENPTAYYGMNETSGTTLFDQSAGALYNLTISGSPVQAQYRAVGPQAQMTKTFDGSDDYCEGTGPAISTVRAVLVWIYLEGPVGATTWLCSQGVGGGSPTYSWGMGINTSQQLAVSTWTSPGAAVVSATSTRPIIPRRWTQIGYLYSSASSYLFLYQDGEEIARSTSFSGTPGTGTTLAIGRRHDNSGSKFNGHMAHFAMWNANIPTFRNVRDLYQRGRQLWVPSLSRRLVKK